MTLGEFKSYCLSKADVTENYPFKGECVWIKVKGKMFAMANVQVITVDGEKVHPFYLINLKCDPERARALRESHDAIRPGWHQNKEHWNSLIMDGSLPDELILELIDHSYELVAPKK